MRLYRAACVMLFASAAAVAEDTAEPEAGAAPRLAGFAWLEQFKGDWATAHNGTMRCRAVGKQWVINEISFGDGPYSMQTLGYDQKEKRFVGTWVDASSAFVWRYTGSLNAEGTAIVLEAEGPDMQDPTKMRRYRDIYEFKSKDELVARAQVADEAGQWKTFGTSTMKRKAD